MPARARATTRALAVSTGALALLVAAGCSGPDTTVEQADEEPKQSEQEETPSPTPTPSTPDISKEPYVQVALDYYEAFNKANDTGEVQRLRELSTKDCKACRLTADRLEEIYANGGHIEGGDLERLPDVGLTVAGKIDEGSVNVTIIYEYQKESVVEKSGAKPEKYPKEPTKKIFTMEQEGETWKVADLITKDYEK